MWFNPLTPAVPACEQLLLAGFCKATCTRNSIKSTKRKLTNKQNYLGLEDAVEFIIDDKIEDGEYDLVIVPPDLRVVSDEKEENEDDLDSSTFPLSDKMFKNLLHDFRLLGYRATGTICENRTKRPDADFDYRFDTIGSNFDYIERFEEVV
ncbi:unnamed protein product [Ceratitis capitata]|uniref:(Mediterranean fruit fly) hypothetical protein n=1 Tax=Ceratitis capitata TaxID=7213 RepID=A0A811VIE2_CERCA|nr:unnamed protein product [Ceratitis capitata]